MSSSLRVLVPLVLAACAGGAGCADFSRGPDSPPAVDAGSDDAAKDGGEDGAAASFASTVHPLLISACQGCHAAGAQAGDTQLLLTGDTAADYATVSRFVNASSPAGSRLLSKASGNGHGGGTVLAAGSPEYQAVLDWIQQGALP